MEVILVKPLKKVGKIGSLVNVKNGFGRNWLIPQGFAIRATEKNKQLIESQKHDLEERNSKAMADSEIIAKIINDKDLMFIRQSAADGRLFGSVNNKEIAKELSNIAESEIAPTCIALEAPLKTIGVFEVEVNLHHDVTCNITVTIARSASEAQDALRNFKTGEDVSESNDDEAFTEDSTPSEEA
jgi:large subunit ribosomal protein L9